MENLLKFKISNSLLLKFEKENFNKIQISKSDFIIISINTKIDNYIELNSRYNFNASNQFEFLSKFINKFQTKKIHELKGLYSIIYVNKNILYLFRDDIGISPLFYSINKDEKKKKSYNNDENNSDDEDNKIDNQLTTIEIKLDLIKYNNINNSNNFNNNNNKTSNNNNFNNDYNFNPSKNDYSYEFNLLNPQKILLIDSNNPSEKLVNKNKLFYKLNFNEKISKKTILNINNNSNRESNVETKREIEIRSNIKELLMKSLLKLDKNQEYGILFSGGTDSTLLAILMKELGFKIKLFTGNIIGGNIKEGSDIYYAKKIAKELDLELFIGKIKMDEIEKISSKIIKIINSKNYTKISVALPFYAALKKAREENINNIIIGIGSEEIFADYRRNEKLDYSKINDVCLEGLESLWERDLYRDYALSKYFGMNLEFPFLDNDFINYSINIEPELKIKRINIKTNKGRSKETNKEINKYILRTILKEFGLKDEFVFRKKVAAQYGSKSDRAFEKISKKQGLLKQKFLNNLN